MDNLPEREQHDVRQEDGPPLKRSRSKMIAGDVQMEGAAARATANALSDLQRRCSYPNRPIVGELLCKFQRASAVSPQESRDVSFVWTFSYRPSNAGGCRDITGSSVVETTARRIVYAPRPLFPPRDVMNAACVALCLEQLPFVSKRLPFAKGLGEILVIAIGSPKTILKLPEYQLAQAPPTKAKTKD